MIRTDLGAGDKRRQPSRENARSGSHPTTLLHWFKSECAIAVGSYNMRIMFGFIVAWVAFASLGCAMTDAQRAELNEMLGAMSAGTVGAQTPGEALSGAAAATSGRASVYPHYPPSDHGFRPPAHSSHPSYQPQPPPVQDQRLVRCPDGSWAAGTRCIRCPDGTWVGGSRCVRTPDGRWIGQ